MPCQAGGGCDRDEEGRLVALLAPCPGLRGVKVATRELDAIEAQRRRMPAVLMPDYTLEGEEGNVRLAEVTDLQRFPGHRRGLRPEERVSFGHPADGELGVSGAGRSGIPS